MPKQLNTRIQLKSDTEANWNKAGPKDNGSNGFVPLLGELIVYLPDETHPFSRLKIGDGNTNVISLPFVDAGSVNGESIPESDILTYASKDLFPSPGLTDKLYVDLNTNLIYCFTNIGEYVQICNYQLSLTKEKSITKWVEGRPTGLSSSNGILKITSGASPILGYNDMKFVTNVVME